MTGRSGVWRGLSFLSLLVSGAAAELGPPGGARWLDGRSVGRPFLDLAYPEWTPVAPGEVSAFDLALPFRGALYDTLLVGPEPGTARLTWRGSGEPVPSSDDRRPAEAILPPPAWLLVQPLGPDLAVGPATSIRVRADDDFVAIRWAGLHDAWNGPATFEVLLAPDGEVTYQYLQVPISMRAAPELSGILLEDASRASGRIEPAREGFAPGPGEVIVFPPDLPWDPHAGCGTATPWCDVLRAYDPGCLTQPPQHLDATPCSTTESRRWHFNENQFCRSCPYVLYVTVECGKAMHLPFLDMEGNQVRIIDVLTGVELELEAINECARAPFQYCDQCPAAINRPPMCPSMWPGPWLDCEPWTQRSTLIQWGSPMQDLDGDGVAAELPCGPMNDSQRCYDSGGNPAFEEQNVDVVLHGKPGLCSVFRLELTSGGFHWFLSANCTGIVPTTQAEIDQNFVIYQNCGDALAAFDPVTELVITRFEFTGACPDIMLDVEVSNIGCVDSPSSPIFIDFDRGNQTDIRDDLGVVPAGGATSKRIPVSLRTTPTTATVTVDPDNLVAECTEQPALSFNGCEPEAGTESITTQLCICVNTVRADVTQQQLYSCDGAPVEINAEPSTAAPCAGGTRQWRFVDGTGRVVQDWLDDATLTVTPARCPGLETYTVEARCSAETGSECVDDVVVRVQCVEAPAMLVVASPLEICVGESVVLTGSSGFVLYEWDNGRTGRSILETPAVDTTYTVTGTDLRGCRATGQVSVRVRPDDMPTSIGPTLRARKLARHVGFSFQEIPTPVGQYELLCHEPQGLAPCGSLRPTDPMPATMQAAGTVALAFTGTPQPALVHQNGLDRCPKLLFYKVLATSACTGFRGPTCDAEPRQLPPCP